MNRLARAASAAIFVRGHVRLAARVLSAAIAPGAPPYLILFVTHRCNARCGVCFDRGQDHPGGELTLAEHQAVAANWRGVLQVTLTGGEPFLRDDLPAIAEAWIQAGAQSLTIDSNGILTDRIVPAVSAILAANPRLMLDLNLSVDGPPELHDRLRGVSGAHQAVMATARALAPLQEAFPGFRLGATVTVSAFNQDQAAATARELVADGRFRRVQAVWVRGRPCDPTALAADFGAYEECMKVLAGTGGGGGALRVKRALAALVRETVARTVRGGRLVRRCRAGETLVEVDAAGRVYPCELLPQLQPGGAPAAGIERWELGGLRDSGYDVGRIMRSDQARRVREWVRDTGCFCTFECAAYNNLVFSPRAWPAIVGKIVAGRSGP
jgi:MoaA/NifB/PqqE/SkfB family radical SAM enzyme